MHATDDNESWIALEFLLLNEESASLKDDYKNPGNIACMHFEGKKIPQV